MLIWLIFLFTLISTSSSAYCPEGCVCTVKSKWKALVNCSSAGYKIFPSAVESPEYDYSKLSSFKEQGHAIEINLSGNELTEAYFPSFLRNVEKIDLSRNEISSMKQIIVDNVMTLKELDLSDNRRLERATRDLNSPSLEVLTLSRCSVREIEEGFLDLVPSIESLDLSYNTLTELNRLYSTDSADFEYPGHVFRKQHRLAYLNLSHNEIHRIHGRDLFNVNVKVLDISNNRMTHAKFTALLHHLEELNVSGNAFESLDSLTLPKAVVLDVSHNNLRHIRVDFDKIAPKLKKLNLSFNALGKIRDIKSSSVSDLDLGHCGIEHIESDAFSRLVALERLNLIGNELTSLDRQLLDDKAHLKFLLLGDNPWDCDCESSRFKALYHFILIERSYSDGGDLRCRHDTDATWLVACKSKLQNEELNIIERGIFYVFLCVLSAVLAILALFGCYTCLRKLRRSAAISFGNAEMTSGEFEHGVATTHSNFSTSREDTFEHDLPVQPPLRRSTPPPNYEVALLLPQLSEEQREIAISTLSLHNVAQ